MRQRIGKIIVGFFFFSLTIPVYLFFFSLCPVFFSNAYFLWENPTITRALIAGKKKQ